MTYAKGKLLSGIYIVLCPFMFKGSSVAATSPITIFFMQKIVDRWVSRARISFKQNFLPNADVTSFKCSFTHK